MHIVIIFTLALFLTTGCAARNLKDTVPVERAAHSRDGLVNIDLKLRAGVTNLWGDGNPMFKIYVQDVDRPGEGATHVISMCGKQHACMLSGTESAGLFDEELFSESVTIAGDSASFKLPAEFFPQSFYVWRTSGRENIPVITFGMGHVVSYKINRISGN